LEFGVDKHCFGFADGGVYGVGSVLAYAGDGEFIVGTQRMNVFDYGVHLFFCEEVGNYGVVLRREFIEDRRVEIGYR